MFRHFFSQLVFGVSLLLTFGARGADVPQVKSFAMGGTHACGLLTNGSLQCWGEGSSGQLGFANRKRSTKPVAHRPEASLNARAVYAGQSTSCAVFEDGRAKCWGNNASGELGLGHDSQTVGGGLNQRLESLPFLDLGKNRKIAQMALGLSHTCAILEGGDLKCWGMNAYGALGLGDNRNRGAEETDMGDNLPPVALGNDRRALSVAAGAYHTCALLDDSSVKCWGYFYGTGSGSTVITGTSATTVPSALKPVELGKGFTPRKLSVGLYHSCVLSTDGRVKCWGLSQGGVVPGKPIGTTIGSAPNQMGDALPVVPLSDGLAALDLSCGAVHCCALIENGAVKCWGANYSGQLGMGDRLNRGSNLEELGEGLSYVDLGKLAQAKAIHVSGNQSCATLATGQIKCWGANQNGQLGIGQAIADMGSMPGQLGEKLPAVDFVP